MLVQKLTRTVIVFVLVATCPPLFLGEAFGPPEGHAEIAGTSSKQAINEIPQGAIDGWNGCFVLRHLPYPGRPVRVYRNGVGLTSGIDFQIAGKQLTIMTPELPQVGDSIEVSYFPHTRDSTLDTRVSTTPNIGPALQPRYTDEISIDAMKRAITDELDRITQISSQTYLRQSVLQSNRYHSSGPMLPRSLQMLSAATDATATGLQGVEGLGDIGVPSNYLDLRAKSHRDGRRQYQPNDGKPQSQHRGTKVYMNDRSSGYAIQMLERGLGADDQLLSSPQRSSAAIEMLEERLGVDAVAAF